MVTSVLLDKKRNQMYSLKKEKLTITGSTFSVLLLAHIVLSVVDFVSRSRTTTLD